MKNFIESIRTGKHLNNAAASAQSNMTSILDISLVKKFKITERYAVSFRAEAYNLFNNANFGAPNANLVTSATFGKLGSPVGSARITQMALRYEF